MGNRALQIGCGIFLVVCVIAAISIAGSIKDIDSDEVVVVHNTYNGGLSDPQTQKKTLKWVWQEWFVFRKSLISKTYNTDCWSQDSVDIKFDVSLQYHYVDSDLSHTIKEFGTETKYLAYVDKFLLDSIITLCSDYTSIQYYLLRDNIDTALYDNITHNIQKIDKFGIVVDSVQLTNIVLPNELKSVIETKQNTELGISVANNNRDIKITNAYALLNTTKQEAETIKINANTTANSNILQAQQQSNSEINSWNYTGIALKYVKDTMQLNETQLLNYLRDEIIRRSPHLYVNYQKN